MNTLETLKGMLRKKDNVIANEGVKITLIGNKEGPVASDVKIVFEPDSGQKAIEFLETIKQNQMSNVSIKFPKPKEASKAPVIVETPTKIAKLKGIANKTALLLFDSFAITIVLPFYFFQSF